MKRNFKGTGGKWSVGKVSSVIVSDCVDIDATSETKHYGGQMIAESVFDANDAKLIGASKELLEHEQKFIKIMEDWGKDYPEIPIPIAIFEHWNQSEKLIKSLTQEESIPLEKTWTNSSQVARTKQLPDTSTLVVEFKNGGTYQYSNVPAEVWEASLNAESIGKFIGSEIKGKYEFKKIS